MTGFFLSNESEATKLKLLSSFPGTVEDFFMVAKEIGASLGPFETILKERDRWHTVTAESLRRTLEELGSRLETHLKSERRKGTSNACSTT